MTTRPADSAAPELAWLIERGLPEGFTPPVYYGTYTATTKWTTDAFLAVRFESKADAELFIEHQDLPARAVEHGFIRESADSAAPTRAQVEQAFIDGSVEGSPIDRDGQRPADSAAPAYLPYLRPRVRRVHRPRVRPGDDAVTWKRDPISARIRALPADREKCRRCGYLRINVRHEPDPDNAPEGRAYFDAMRDELHEFVPSGVWQ